jgi:hypothetical protein
MINNLICYYFVVLIVKRFYLSLSVGEVAIFYRYFGLTWLGYICRVKRVTKMTEKVATGVLSGVVKVSGFFTSSIANSKVGKKFFGLLPGEILLASLDGFSMLIISSS